MSKTNLVLMKESKEVLELSTSLGFDKILFLEKDFILFIETNKKKLLKDLRNAKKKGLLTVAKAESEELLRYLLEKTPVDIVYSIESINPKDSMHFPRGGLDQVTCKIAAKEGKIIGFSFSELLNYDLKKRALLMNRIRFNNKLCKKYKVKTYFGNFSSKKFEMRSAKDLKAFYSVLGVSTKTTNL